jgi:hypothetical protein
MLFHRLSYLVGRCLEDILCSKIEKVVCKVKLSVICSRPNPLRLGPDMGHQEPKSMRPLSHKRLSQQHNLCLFLNPNVGPESNLPRCTSFHRVECWPFQMETTDSLGS